MGDTERTITNIQAQLAARGWTVTETLYDDKSPNDCFIELTGPDDAHKGFGRYPRVYCWTEAYRAVTGQPWIDAIT